MMELESEFLTATNEKKVVVILDQACRNVNVANPSRSCGSIDSIIRTNALTHFNPSQSLCMVLHGIVVLVFNSHDALE